LHQTNLTIILIIDSVNNCINAADKFNYYFTV